MPVANNSPAKKTKAAPKKKTGPLSDATAPASRDEVKDAKPSKDGSRRGRLPGVKTKGMQLLEDAQAVIAEKFDIKNFHPVIHMLIVAADEDMDDAIRLNAAAKASPYVAATYRSVELTGEDGGPIEIDLTDKKAKLAQMAGLND